MTYGEAEAKLARVKAGRYYRNLDRAEAEAARELHTALTRVDEQQTANEQFRAEAATKQAAYAAQRQATRAAWMEAKGEQPEQPSAPSRPSKPPGFTL